MKQKTKNKYAGIILILLFVCLNYLIIGCGHTMLYEPGVYSCRHMARDIEDHLESFGIPVTIIRGQNHNNTKAHMWIRVLGIEFDSVYLMPFVSSKYTSLRYEFDDYQDYLDWRHIP
jgi:hypothetical protein